MKNLTIKILSMILMLMYVSPVLAQTKVQDGSWSVNQSVSGFALDKNDGKRAITIEVRFENPFIKKPKVMLSVTQLDADKEANLRYNAEALSISRDGFTIKFRTWSDSKIFSASGYWLAHLEYCSS